uniref:Uncharacterized protein n=1 Tax=Sipha flava TaxID=143950 RepID=A0A2S2Q212_9HEMI
MKRENLGRTGRREIETEQKKKIEQKSTRRTGRQSNQPDMWDAPLPRRRHAYSRLGTYWRAFRSRIFLPVRVPLSRDVRAAHTFRHRRRWLTMQRLCSGFLVPSPAECE